MTLKELLTTAYNSISEGQKLKNHYYDEETGADFFYEIQEEYLKVYIKHTDPELEDWLTNFCAVSYSDKTYGAFHKGYFIAFNNFMRYLLDSGYLHTYNYKEVVITGYSMGGGIAKVAACLFHSYFISKNFKLYAVSMEGPKSINKRANSVCKQHTNIKLFTIRNGNDIVTKIPFNFVDGGTVIQIGEKREWWKLGIKFEYNKDKKGIRKFIDIPEHHYASFKENLKKYINEVEENEL